MKELYENAEMEVVEFSEEDVVFTSGATTELETAETGEYELGGDPWGGDGGGGSWG